MAVSASKLAVRREVKRRFTRFQSKNSTTVGMVLTTFREKDI